VIDTVGVGLGALAATLGLAVPVGLATVGGAPQAVRRTTAASRKRLI